MRNKYEMKARSKYLRRIRKYKKAARDEELNKISNNDNNKCDELQNLAHLLSIQLYNPEHIWYEPDCD